MKNIKYLLIIIFTFLISYSGLSQQPVNINEGFENGVPPAGWINEGFIQDNQQHTGSYSALADGTQMKRLITPQFQVIAGEAFSITYWYRHVGNNANASFVVKLVGKTFNIRIDSVVVPNGTWHQKILTVENIPANDTASFYFEATTVTNTGRKFIDDISIIKTTMLPVTMVSFNSAVTKNIVTLNWTTSEEINNSGFEIYRSIAVPTGQLWEKIGFVKGNGNSNTLINYSYSDKYLNTGAYNYKLKQIDYNGNFEYFQLNNSVIIGKPDEFIVYQNYPNPSNPASKISFEIPEASLVSVKVYDMSGKEVKSLTNEYKEAGYYTINFNGSDLSSGIYFYVIKSGKFSKTMKMVLIK